ncbi:MAG: cache domain-containing protein, partial [Desulfobacterales bacterium]
MKKMSLQNRFLLPALTLLIAGMGGISTVSYLKAKSTLEKEATAQLSQIAESTLRFVDSWVENNKIFIIDLADDPVTHFLLQEIDEGNVLLSNINQRLARLKSRHVYLEDINIVNLSGDILASSDEKVIGRINIGDRSYFQLAMKGETNISQVLISRKTEAPIFVLATPVKAGEQIIGVVFAVVDISAFTTRFIDNIKVAKTGYAYVCDKEGNVVAHPDRSVFMKTKLTDFEFGREIMEKNSGIVSYEWEGKDKLAAFRTSRICGWIIVVGANCDELLEGAHELRNWNAVITVALLIIAVCVTLLTVKSVVKPVTGFINALSEAAEQVSAGSVQVSHAGSHLAENASRQAAAIEECASSLEETASMTRNNAEHTGQARSMMGESDRVSEQVSRHMSRMVQAIGTITQYSEDTGKIIKNIDEIAF